MLYKYKVITAQGEEQNGTIDSLNMESAITLLQQRGLTIINIVPESKKSLFEKDIFLSKSVPIRDVVILSRQISTLFAAHVSALRVFRLLASESENRLLASVLDEVGRDIQGGASISDALAKHPNVFSDFYVNMVRAGEESGKLNDIFTYLAEYLDKSYAMTAKAKNALIYPALVMIVFVVVVVLLLTMVFPQLTSILKPTHQPIPLYTQVVIGISDFLVQYGLFILATIIILGLVGWRQLKTPEGKYMFSHFIVGLPVIGKLVSKFFLARIADNMFTMLTSGVTIVKTLEVTAPIVGNAVFEAIVREAADDVKKGSSLSDSFAKHREIPGIMVLIIRVGEETGVMGNILKTLSDFYTREVATAVDTLVSMIEPIMIVFRGVFVGILVASVLVPMYNAASGI